MTKDKFIELLRTTPRDWYINPNGAIRRANPQEPQQCPISSIADVGCTDWHVVAHLLGIDRMTALAIVSAADECEAHDPELRRELLAACGLEEKSQNVLP